MSWLKRIGLNKLRNACRREAGVKHGARKIVSLDDAGAETLADPQPQAEALLEQRERLGRIEQALQRVDRLERELLTRHYLEETSLRALAAEAGVTPPAIRGRVSRAIAHVRSELRVLERLDMPE